MQLLLWLQQVTPPAAAPDAFLPTTLGGWATLVGIIGGMALGAWRFAMKPLRDAIKAETEARVTADANRDLRVAEIATAATTAIGRLEILERQLDRVSQSAIAMQDTATRLETRVSGSLDAMHLMEKEWLRELGDVRERLGSIDAQIKKNGSTKG